MSKSYEIEDCEGTANMLDAQFANCFTDIYKFAEKRETIFKRASEVMGEEIWGKPIEEMILCPGENSNSSSPLTDVFHRISELFKEGNELPNETPLEFGSLDPGLILELASSSLFEVSTKEIDQMFTNLTKFAKIVPGFLHLEMEDRIVLIKQGKTELLNIIRYVN